jgi:RimJ/RimL family protein N-acetyltransferase
VSEERRRTPAPRRIVLPAEPLVAGPTALRPWRDSDRAALAVACQDPEIARWTRVPPNYTEHDARLYLLERYDAIGAGASAPFAIVAADDLDRLLGSTSLMRFDWANERGEVGYWLAPDARGQGHATRAVQLICAWGLHSLGLARIELQADVLNIPSQEVAVRAGFTRDAVLRSWLEKQGRRQDLVAFSLLATDPEAVGGAGRR